MLTVLTMAGMTLAACALAALRFCIRALGWTILVGALFYVFFGDRHMAEYAAVAVALVLAYVVG